MSTSRRLAKRSIIGTKVCAPGPDGLWYSGVIQDVKTPASASATGCSVPMPPPTFLAPGDTQLNADTRYIVRFDFKTHALQPGVIAHGMSAESVIVETRRAAAAAAAAANIHHNPVQAIRRNAMTKEFRETDLIGPGFRSIMSIQLQPGQRIFLTYNGREQSGDVMYHDIDKDEVTIKINTHGNEEHIELKKRLEEVRLLESRRSARLADQDRDTDFARLADMGGDRRRGATHSIEVPLTLTPQQNSRKRPPCDDGDQSKDDEMNECNAALILMNLHNSPNPVPDKWLGNSPGSSSSASWSSGSASPPLSDDGSALLHAHLPPYEQTAAMANARIRTTSVSTSDEGIVMDFKEERKKKSKKFRCTFPRCGVVELTQTKIERHVRDKHLGKKARRADEYDSCSEHEEDFYYTEDDDDDETLVTAPSPASPPTLSHWDMARPQHEDPEFQKQMVGNFKQGRAMNNFHHLPQQQPQLTPGNSSSSSNSNSNGSGHITSTQQLQLHNNNTSCIPTWTPISAMTLSPNPTPHQQTLQSSSATLKHTRTLRPSHSAAPYPSPTYVHHHHHNYSNSAASSNSSNSNSNSNSSSSSNGSPVIHSANNMLQQLSQQNVTVTAHHSVNSNGGQPLQHQQQHHLSSVTITPNYHPPQQHMRGQQQTTASNNLIANAGQHIQLQHVAVQHAVNAARHSSNSPHRRTRGENKKCRKVYGMERREQWCTQCRWKKACSRFGD